MEFEWTFLLNYHASHFLKRRCDYIKLTFFFGIIKHLISGFIIFYSKILSAKVTMKIKNSFIFIIFIILHYYLFPVVFGAFAFFVFDHSNIKKSTWMQITWIRIYIIRPQHNFRLCSWLHLHVHALSFC